MLYKRQIQVSEKSFFLFGPRGTGKSTWIKDQFKPDLSLDLLSSSQYLEFSAEPSVLSQKVLALKPKSKVVIDEIQKLPQLLDEVHRLVFEQNHKTQFALTGSSARKIKKTKANLLAGRAINRRMFGLNSAELANDFDIEAILHYGSLPTVFNLSTHAEKVEYLMSYVENYLREEIHAESAVRNLSSYHRFLKHAAGMNAHVVNLNTISREASVARSTLDGYFSIIDETLLGHFVEPLHLKAKIKEVSTPKFYFFDCGVVRALRNEVDDKLDDIEKGYLFETFLLNEILSYSSYLQKYYEVYYWGTPSHNEVDFLVSKGKIKVGIEVKASKNWRSSFNQGLEVLIEAKKINRAYGVYLGKEPLKVGKIEVLPLKMFLQALHAGQLISSV